MNFRFHSVRVTLVLCVSKRRGMTTKKPEEATYNYGWDFL